MLCIPFFPIAGWYYLSEAKKLILVFIDYKKQILVKDTFKIQNVGYEVCSEPRNGAYFTVKFYDDKREFWLYKRSQIYSEFVTDEEYEVTYYKYSRCIHSIKRLTFNKADDIISLNKSKLKKKYLLSIKGNSEAVSLLSINGSGVFAISRTLSTEKAKFVRQHKLEEGNTDGDYATLMAFSQKRNLVKMQLLSLSR